MEPLPLPHPDRAPFVYPFPPPSPHRHGGPVDPSVPPGSARFGLPAPRHAHHHRRDRAPASSQPPRWRPSAGLTATSAVHGPGILPTPDPTVASCISDEDVAIQLMRLGDASNISHGTRHSASTLDDGLSGTAEIASSTGATTDVEEADRPTSEPDEASSTLESSPVPPPPGLTRRAPRHLDDILPSSASTESSADEGLGPPPPPPPPPPLPPVPTSPAVVEATAVVACLVRSPPPAVAGVQDGVLATDPTVEDPTARPLTPAPRQPTTVKPRAGRPSTIKARSKPAKPRLVPPPKSWREGSALATPKAPISPASMSAHSRKPSSSSATLQFHHALREDEEDLSSKPRCQRCRKSKKGCDRQRPCQRCVDAGIGIDGCISEDETNGRKGRFGRHMGVAVKKAGSMPFSPADLISSSAATSVPADDFPPAATAALSTLTPLTDQGTDLSDPSKKRKR